MSSTALKLIALFTMLLDHIGVFIPGSPIWLRYIGRISAPIFLFCMVWGVHYTHDKKKYLLRMYCFGVGMGILDLICNNIIDKPYQYIENDIFVSLFCIAVAATLIEIRKKDKMKGNKYLLLFVLYQVITTVVCSGISSLIPLCGINHFVAAITANILFSEGNWVFFVLGIIVYQTKESRKGCAFAYTMSCVVMIALWLVAYYFQYRSSMSLFDYMTKEDYQWMMIGSALFMLLYNGKKGRGLKYLFYIFYPVHLMILYWVGNLCF